MKILILGSTGGTGQELVAQSLNQNHKVTALARDPSMLKIVHERLAVVKGNILDKDVMTNVVEGQDAVISALGVGKSLKSKSLISNAVNMIIPAMKAKNVKRLVFLSAFGVGETFKQADFIQKIAFKLFLRNIYADKSKADDEIRRSTLDWTLIHPVLMTNNPATGKYETGEKLEMRGMPKISRADVAEFMLRQLNDNTFLKKSVVITQINKKKN